MAESGKKIFGASRARTLRILCAVVLPIGAFALGCEGGKGTRDALKELQDGQKQVLERLDKILASPIFARAERPSVDFNKVYEITIGDSPARGPQEAKATLVEFSDFQCPYSQRAQPVIQQLLEAFPNDLRHVYKNFPLSFHKQALPAAKACLAAGLQGKFWEMHKLLYENPKSLEEQDFKAHAQKLGLDVARFEKDLQSDAQMQKVQADLEEARKAEVRGTPTLYLNGKRVADRSFEAMKKEIETLLGTAVNKAS